MCNHEHLRTVNDRLFCMDCGVELPMEFLTKPKRKKKAKTDKEQK